MYHMQTRLLIVYRNSLILMSQLQRAVFREGNQLLLKEIYGSTIPCENTVLYFSAFYAVS